MANNFRVPPKNYKLGQGLPKTGAGSKAGDPVANKGVVGVNAWGTGKGQGIAEGSDYGMIAVDGVAVVKVNVAAAITENDPIYITSANALTTVETGNTLFGIADEPSAINASAKIGVNIKSQVNV